jgi:hypothetical protein
MASAEHVPAAPAPAPEEQPVAAKSEIPPTAWAAPGASPTIAGACAAIAASLDLAFEGFSPPYPPFDVIRAANRSLGLPDVLLGSSVKAQLAPICRQLGIANDWQVQGIVGGHQTTPHYELAGPNAVATAAAAAATTLGNLDESVEVATARATGAPVPSSEPEVTRLPDEAEFGTRSSISTPLLTVDVEQPTAAAAAAAPLAAAALTSPKPALLSSGTVVGAAQPTPRGELPVLADATGRVYMQTFNEDHPIYPEGVVSKYFPRLHSEHYRRGSTRTIGICVPCYNEDQFGLNNTLNSLYALEVPDGFNLSVIVLMDGVKQGVPHASTRKYLSKLYGIDWQQMDQQKQTTIYESLKWFSPSTIRQSSAAPHTSHGSFSSAVSVTAAPRTDFRVSLLVKRRNLRKHNSHQWFMAAFAKELDCKYILCTDCSTVFEKSMLAKLTAFLESNPETTACCGRQRVMSVRLQNEGSGKPLDNEFVNAPMEYILRQIQTYVSAGYPPVLSVAQFLRCLPSYPSS